MDLGSHSFENDKEEEFEYATNRCYYAIVNCPPNKEALTNTLAFVTYIPSNDDSCGLIQVFNPEKGKFGHGFHTSTKILRAKFRHMVGLIERGQKANLVWEGIPNILNYGEIYVKRVTDKFDRFPYFIFN